jgi:hypothetical protein
MSGAVAAHTATTKPAQSNSYASLLLRKCVCGGSAGLTGQCDECNSKKLLGKPLQTKLRISELGDVYEQEADRISRQVMRMADPAIQRAYACGGTCSTCRSEAARERRVQTNRFNPGAGAGATAPPIVDEVLRSPGRPLDETTRVFMAPRFGYDFSQVRVHTDSRAAESARAINALAYTAGSSIVFGAGQYVPESSVGRELIAHELTHVLQQAQGAGTAGTHVSTGLAQRQPAPKPVTFPGCTEENTLVANPNLQLATAVKFAADLVDAAIGAIGRNDTTNETYRTALARHFLNPTLSQRKELFRSFRRVWFHLKPENFACASSTKELDECAKVTNEGFDLAFTPTIQGVGVGASVLCPAFWEDRLPCRAITLIHESAHARGIGNGGTHPPNRGSAPYPSLGGAPPAAQTAALRMDNPDAYAFFAAHIGRETDTDCSGGAELPIDPRTVIRVRGTAPKK